MQLILQISSVDRKWSQKLSVIIYRPQATVRSPAAYMRHLCDHPRSAYDIPAITCVHRMDVVFISLLSQMFCIVLFLFCMHSWFAKTQIIFLPYHSNLSILKCLCRILGFFVYWWVSNSTIKFAQHKMWIDIHLFYEEKKYSVMSLPNSTVSTVVKPCTKRTTITIMERRIFLSILYYTLEEKNQSNIVVSQTVRFLLYKY